MLDFDPTNDYYGEMHNDEDRVTFQFWEFLKLLITLGDPAENQKSIMGYGEVAFEMVDEFHQYYTQQQEAYVKAGLITQEQEWLIDELKEFFEMHDGDYDPSFWNDDELGSHPAWDTVRNMVGNLLVGLQYTGLEVYAVREVEEQSDVSIERTKTYLRRFS